MNVGLFNDVLKWEGVHINELEKIIMILLNLGMLNLLEQSRT